MPEITRIVDQLSRAFERGPWHGPALKTNLTGVTAAMASSRPLKGAHNIWEIALHPQVWLKLARLALEGQPMPTELPPNQDWPRVRERGPGDWEAVIEALDHEYRLLLEAVANLQEPDLAHKVPGRAYDLYFLLHGTVQDAIYHADQISKSALSKKRTVTNHRERYCRIGQDCETALA